MQLVDNEVYPPLPEIDDETRFFWEGVEQGKLMLLRCDDCKYYVHFPRPICPKCLSTDLSPHEVSGRGTLFTYTVTIQAFHPYFVDKVPYVLAIVALAEQDDLRFTTNIVGCDEQDLHIGLPVKVTFQEVAPGYTLPMFTPA